MYLAVYTAIRGDLLLKLQTLLSGRTSGLLVATLATAFSLSADTFTVTPSAPGVQTPTTPYYETFNSAPLSGGSYTTTFNGSGITGTYGGSFGVTPADYYGGAGGTGNYAVTFTGLSYTLALSSNVNYFGAWFSAIDPGSQVSFYNGSSWVYTETGTMLMSGLGTCPGGAYCGNPNTQFLGADPAQPYAYLNFFDTTGSFNSIQFQENAGGNGFETDNQAVASMTPEPAAMGLMFIGVAGLAAMYRRRASRSN